MVIKGGKEASYYHLLKHPLSPIQGMAPGRPQPHPLPPLRPYWQQREPILPKLLTAFTANKRQNWTRLLLPSSFLQAPAQSTTSALRKEKEMRNYGQN